MLEKVVTNILLHNYEKKAHSRPSHQKIRSNESDRSDFRFQSSNIPTRTCEGLEWSIAGQARHLPPVVIPLVSC